MDGFILLPVINSDKDLLPAQVEIPIIVVSPRDDTLIDGDAIILDYTRALEHTMNHFDHHGKKRVAMILDGSFLYNEKIIDIYNKHRNDKELLKITDYSKESKEKFPCFI